MIPLRNGKDTVTWILILRRVCIIRESAMKQKSANYMIFKEALEKSCFTPFLASDLMKFGDRNLKNEIPIYDFFSGKRGPFLVSFV